MYHCLIPVSIGELFDKYTILEIKQEFITDSNKLSYLKQEIDLLDDEISKYPVNYKLIISLKNVNAKLWDIEDKIRLKEKKQQFDDEFIQLARSVYITNDERCRIKNSISALFNGDIIDVKSYVDYNNESVVKPKEQPVKPKEQPVNQNDDVILLNLSASETEIPEKIFTHSTNPIIETNADHFNKYGETNADKFAQLAEQQTNNTDNHIEIRSQIEKYKKKLKTDKKNVDHIKKIAELAKSMEDYETAIQYFTDLIYLTPYDGSSINELGVCYYENKNYARAIEIFNQVLKLKNDIPDVYANIGATYQANRQYNEAIVAYNVANDLNKDERYYNALGSIYFYKKDYNKAITMYDYVHKQEYNPKYQLSFIHMAMNDFKTGLPLYENRLNDGNPIHPQTKMPTRLELGFLDYWDGKQHCDHLLLVYEQGLGDNIQIYRYMIELARKLPNMQISFFCNNGISNIFDSPCNNLILITNLNQYTTYNYKLYTMSLPFILNCTKIVPNKDNYIYVNPDKNKYWKNELSKLKKYKVAFTYKGFLISFIDKNVPFECFASLCDLDIDLICLHRKSEIGNDSIHKPENMHIYDIDVDKPFEDTIAILNNIDLFIAIDSVGIHISGVMNVPSWLLLGYGSDWRWGKTYKKSIWYDNVELIRLTENVPFETIMPKVKSKLEKHLNNAKAK